MKVSSIIQFFISKKRRESFLYKKVKIFFNLKKRLTLYKKKTIQF